MSMYFNPRFPRGKRRLLLWRNVGHYSISIHASREGSDSIGFLTGGKQDDFNPRFPRGKRPTIPHGCKIVECISIHASREGSDIQCRLILCFDADFNPRFPRGKRRPHPQRRTGRQEFQSTLPAREATYGIQQGVNHAQISIHASREGSDQAAVDMAADWYHFNPRFPRGKRRVLRGVLTVLRHFNPRFPRGKRRQFKGADPKELAISIHASREGSDGQWTRIHT